MDKSKNVKTSSKGLKPRMLFSNSQNLFDVSLSSSMSSLPSIAVKEERQLEERSMNEETEPQQFGIGIPGI